MDFVCVCTRVSEIWKEENGKFYNLKVMKWKWCDNVFLQHYRDKAKRQRLLLCRKKGLK